MKSLLIGILLLISTNAFADCNQALNNEALCSYNYYKNELIVLEVNIQKDTTYEVVGDTVHLKNTSMGGSLKNVNLEDMVNMLQFGNSILISKLDSGLRIKSIKKVFNKLLITYSNR